MKMKLFFSLMLICLLILKGNGALFAQASGNEQRLVGTWVHLHTDGINFVFNADGTMATDGIMFDGFIPTHWAAAGDRLLVYRRGANWGQERAIRYFNISSDGRTLIISTIAVQHGGMGAV